MSEDRYVYVQICLSTLPMCIVYAHLNDFTSFDTDYYERGVWHSKTGVKGQDRSSASPRLNTGAQDKKASQSSTKGGAGRGQGTGKDRANIWQGPEAARQPEPSPASVAEEHIPMNNYNAREVEAAMKSPVEPRPLVYKAAEKIPSGGRFGAAPWGSKRVFCKPQTTPTPTDEQQRAAWRAERISGLIYENSTQLFSEVVEQEKVADTTPSLLHSSSCAYMAFQRCIIYPTAFIHRHSVANGTLAVYCSDLWLAFVGTMVFTRELSERQLYSIILEPQ